MCCAIQNHGSLSSGNDVVVGTFLVSVGDGGVRWKWRMYAMALWSVCGRSVR